MGEVPFFFNFMTFSLPHLMAGFMVIYMFYSTPFLLPTILTAPHRPESNINGAALESAWVQILVLPPTRDVTSSKSFASLGFVSLIFQIGEIIPPSYRVVSK